MIFPNEYLSNYREEEPAWIGNYLRGQQITFRDIMSSRVAYYPGSGYDGTFRFPVGSFQTDIFKQRFHYVD